MMHREIIYLNCDGQEFKEWFKTSYSEKTSDYEEHKPNIFSFTLDFTVIRVAYAVEQENHKFFFDCYDYDGGSDEALTFELFLSAIRNKFGILQADQAKKKGGRHRDQHYDEIQVLMEQGMTKQEAMRKCGFDPTDEDQRNKVYKALKRRKD